MHRSYRVIELAVVVYGGERSSQAAYLGHDQHATPLQHEILFIQNQARLGPGWSEEDGR